ncbi:MAG: GMP/IMP nucleotidase [Pseudomonadales bacterium]
MSTTSLQQPQSGSPSTLNWDQIDTVLLDMDGTLLDLCYDNHVWNQMLPQRLAEQRHPQTSPELVAQTAAELLTHMRSVMGTITFYSLDYWADYTQLDLIALHEEFGHLVAFRPSAQTFLQRLGEHNIQRVLATNAHRDSLAIKHQHSGINDLLDLSISSHDYGHPKEAQAFWQSLQEDVGFDSARTLFIDDNEPVLASARDFGIGHLRIVSQPDSARPDRVGLEYPAFNDFAEIMPPPVVAP